MLNDYLQIHTVSTVFIGEFNPVIIQPFWLANKKLIREQEAQNAKVEIIHNQLVKFEIDWAQVEITQNRFEIKTSQEPYFEPLKDLAISIFDILRETPITTLGVNHIKYFSLNDAETHYQFGNKLSPLTNWSDVINDPRLNFLEILETKRRDGLKGIFRVIVQQPEIKLSTPFGVKILVNDEVHLNSNEDGRNGEMIKHLGNIWKGSFVRASEVIESMWSKIK